MLPFLALFFLAIGIPASAQHQADSVTDTISYEMIHIEDSAQAFASVPEPIARVKNELPQFQGDSAAGWMNQQARMILKLNPEDSLQAAVHESQQRYLADYTHVMQDFKDDSLRASLNYENISQMGLGYNKNNYVVLRHAIYDYSGGAHGMHGIGYYCFDLEDQKSMELVDIVDMDSTALQSLLETQFRKDYDLSAEQSLKEILFDDYLKANDNFFFTDEGLGFCYGPYEVAPYAAGVIDVVIPYHQLADHLQPAFAYRMGIDTDTPAPTVTSDSTSAADSTTLKPTER